MTNFQGFKVNENQNISDFADQINQARNEKRKLFIRGGGSKSFLTDASSTSSTIDMSNYCGIISYEPSELVITVRAGTRLQSVESMLSSRGQRFPFEPPLFDNNTTVGGMVASGLSGPARPYAGSIRDAVLGVKMLNGKGELLSFGGQVIKNVAGYDLSRLMTGSFGTLGVILEVSLKVLPVPQLQKTICIESDKANLIQSLHKIHLDTNNVTGLAAVNDTIFCRISGGSRAVEQITKALPGDVITSGEVFWTALKNQKIDFFQSDESLWRVSLPPATKSWDINAEVLFDWGGALQWLKTDELPANIVSKAKSLGGSAYQFRAGSKGDRLPLMYLSDGISLLHNRITRAFDPDKVFDAGSFFSQNRLFGERKS